MKRVYDVNPDGAVKGFLMLGAIIAMIVDDIRDEVKR